MTVKAIKRFYDLGERKYIESGEEISTNEERAQKMIARGLVERVRAHPVPNSTRNKKGDD